MDTPHAIPLPADIEIFRPGRHIDDAGGIHDFSPADLSAMVAAYNPALREAPLTVGHPESNLPAYGWVRALALNAAGRLVMNTHQVQPQFAEWVQKRLFKKRSASFYPPQHPNNPTPGTWYLRHVAFLGAQPPAVSGLADFADDVVGAVSFSEGVAAPASPTKPTSPTQEHRTMTDEEKAAIARAEKAEADAKAATEARSAAEADAKAAKDQLAQFAEQQRQGRHAGYVAFAEAEVKAGRLLPKDAGAAVAVLDLLADAAPVDFAEGGTVKKLAPADWLKGLISAGQPVVSFGEFAPGSAAPAAGGARGLSDAEVDTRARAYAAQHKVSYAEAVSAVVVSFSA